MQAKIENQGLTCFEYHADKLQVFAKTSASTKPCKNNN
jgi:hypothetical protein